MKNRQNRSTLLVHVFLTIILLLSLSPVTLLVLNSLKTGAEVLASPMGLPAVPQWGNFVEVWTRGGYASAFVNSLGVMAITITVVVLSCASCAYAMAKLRPRGGRFVSNYFMFTMSISVALCLVPLFFVWMRLNLMDTLRGLILIYIGNSIPLIVIIMRSFFIGIPDAILESARIDGCNELNVLTRIIFPISKPIFLTGSLLVGLSVWNEFFYANSFIQSDHLRTVATRYLVFTGRFSSDWSMICAAGVITILPMVVIYLIFQRQFIEGLTSGSIKG